MINVSGKHRDTENIKILAYLSFLREVVIFTSNGKMIFYQYYVNIVRQTIIWRRGLVLVTYVFVKDILLNWLLRLTSQLSWVAAWLLVTRVFPVYLVGREESWERWESSVLGRWERCMSGVRWQGGKGGRIVSWHSQRGGKVMRWQFGKRWGGGEVSEMARREIPCVIQ